MKIFKKKDVKKLKNLESLVKKNLYGSFATKSFEKLILRNVELSFDEKR